MLSIRSTALENGCELEQRGFGSEPGVRAQVFQKRNGAVMLISLGSHSNTGQASLFASLAAIEPEKHVNSGK